MKTLFVCCALVLSSAPPLAAQDARLVGRVEAATLARLSAIINEAGARDIPTEPLVQKALEGVSKHARGDAIERAVRALAERLAIARTHLGSAAPVADLSAAASALYVGVTPASLSRLRALRPHDALAMPLHTLTHFVQRGVPVDASLGWVESLLNANVAPDDMFQLHRLIDTDVKAGADVHAASATRVQALLLRYRSVP